MAFKMKGPSLYRNSPIKQEVSSFDKFAEMGRASGNKGANNAIIDADKYFKEDSRVGKTKIKRPKSKKAKSTYVEPMAKDEIKIKGDGDGMNTKKKTNQFGIETISYGI